ncbi:hypothetical protein M434DRAFT_28118 [Hypoxylon sp. CO27-5]|nr:hypothetical protein M434DRAFT_28118 [Hypoxylon sp. CO27-5]
MDPSTGLSFHEAWSKKKDIIVAKHKSDLALQEDLLEKEEQELRLTNECNLQKLKATLPSALYRDLILPMAEKSLKHDLQELDASHRKRLGFIEKSHLDELARHGLDHHGSHMEELARQEKLKASTPVNERPAAMDGILSGLPEAADAEGSEISQSQEVSLGPDRPEEDDRPMSWNPPASPNPGETPELCKPLTCTIQPEIICGERHLIMRVQSKKRKTSVSKEIPPKRLRLNTAVNSLRTPAPTPSNESAHPPERTITFDEVYQGGKAKHKDTIVEWPVGSKKWYILKCEKHGLRFTRNAIQGAAKHLSGLNHGFPDRNREVALRTLGYLVVDCNESLAKLNNSVADKAYANGYKPPSSKSKNRPNKGRETQEKERRELLKPSWSDTVNSVRASSQGLDLTLKTSEIEEVLESGTPSSHQKPANSWNGITHPKTFHIYYGHWKVSLHRKDDRIYPVMILGWDNQNGSGLKDTDLNATGLLKKNSQPPNCYIYDSNRIIDWAPGFEDGGPKVRSRKFPVMFFDESQTVAWIPARDLMEFPLYKRKAPDQSDHPFNAARRWIAEREGFKTWEDREKARIASLTALPPSPSPLTPVEESSIIASRIGERGRRSVTPRPHFSADSDDSESSGSEAEATSIGTADTEKMMEDWREKGGEITGDDDYSLSGSDIDETLDCEIDDWNRSSMSTMGINNNTANRPWAFYDLRNTENTKELRLPNTPTYERQGSRLMTGGMGSARRLAMQACHLSGAYSYITDSRGSLRTPTEAKEDVPSSVQGPVQSNRPFSANEAFSTEARIDDDGLAETIRRALGFTNQNQATSRLAESPRPTSQHSESGLRHNAPIQFASGDRRASVPQVRAIGFTPPTPTIAIGNPDRLLASEIKRGKAVRDSFRARLEVEAVSSPSCATSNEAKTAALEESPEGYAEGQATEDSHLPVHNRQVAAQKENGLAQRKGGYMDEATVHKESTLPEVRMVSPSIDSPRDINVPMPIISPVGGNANAEFPRTKPDFELSLYSKGEVSWERSDEQEDCIQLFHGADRKVTASWRGPVDVMIQPMEIFGFSRELLEDSNGNNVFVLRNKDGSSSRLIFGRSKGSQLENGKVQARGFIKWLRHVNPTVKCLEP